MKLKHENPVFSLFGIIFLLFLSNSISITYAQQQHPNSSGLSAICKIVQGNRLLSGFTGLGQAVTICNSLNTINSQQALSKICSVVGGFGINNLKNICNQQQQQQQQQQQGAQTQSLQQNNIQNNNESPSSSLGSKVMGSFTSLFR